MRYEYYSNVALVSSVVVYVLAMFAHAAEWAAARRLGAGRGARAGACQCFGRRARAFGGFQYAP